MVSLCPLRDATGALASEPADQGSGVLRPSLGGGLSPVELPTQVQPVQAVGTGHDHEQTGAKPGQRHQYQRDEHRNHQYQRPEGALPVIEHPVGQTQPAGVVLVPAVSTAGMATWQVDCLRRRGEQLLQADDLAEVTMGTRFV
jgi:hypothetical protein